MPTLQDVVNKIDGLPTKQDVISIIDSKIGGLATKQDVMNKIDGLATKQDVTNKRLDGLAAKQDAMSKQISDFVAITEQRFNDVDNRLDVIETISAQMQEVLQEKFVKIDTLTTSIVKHEKRILKLETKCA